jgi:hypothetical protein
LGFGFTAASLAKSGNGEAVQQQLLNRNLAQLAPALAVELP